MSDLKDKIINGIIDREGGYVNDPSDSGGETNWGITKQVARRSGYYIEMIKLSRKQAYIIYSANYWDELRLDTIADLSKIIAEEMADTGVNMGVSRAGGFLQRSLNALNNRAKMFPDLIVDGDIGDKTIKALESFLFLRPNEGEYVLFKMLNSLQGAFYIELAERREKDERFIFGWFKHRVA